MKDYFDPQSAWRATILLSALACFGCGDDAPQAPPPLIEPAVLSAEEAAEPVDPNAVLPDASIEAVVVDAGTASTVAGEQGQIPTPEKPVIEVVAYDDLAYVVGERVIVSTTMGTRREGVLKRFFNTGLKLLVDDRGRQFELDMPRGTIGEVKVVWTHAQGAAPAPIQP